MKKKKKKSYGRRAKLSIVSRILHVLNIQWWHLIYIYIYIYSYLVAKFCTDISPTNSCAKWEDCMKAWNFTKNDCDQETGKEYSTIVQIIVKDDRGKAWRSLSCKMTCYHVSDEKTV